MDEKSMARNKAVFAVYFGCLLLTVFSIIIAITSSDFSVNTREYIKYSDHWITDKGDEADLSKVSSYSFIEHELPEISGSTMMYINAKSINIDAYLEDELVYTSDIYERGKYGKTAGSYYISIPLQNDDSYKTVKLVFYDAYGDNSGKITMIQLGRSDDIIRESASSKTAGFAISLIISFLGIIFIVLYTAARKYSIFGNELIYLGLFSFTIGVFMLTDCRLLQIISGNENLYHMIAEMFMMMLAVPLIMFLEKIYDEFKIKTVNIISIICISAFLICYILNMTGIKDYHETVWMTHLTYVITAGYIVFVTIKNLICGDKKAIHHSIGVMFIGLFSVLDILVLYFGSSSETSFFTRLGVLLFMCFEGIEIIKDHIGKYQEGIQAKLVSKLAYHDGLTGMLNRTSFIEDIDKIKLLKNEKILIAVFDVNNLKFVNDNYGHTFGDELIITSASQISQAFESLGKCYRTGGDEFVLISHAEDAENRFTECHKNMLKNLDSLNSISKFPCLVSIAAGYSSDIITDEKSASDIFNEADSNMYENKKIMKEKMKAEKNSGNI